MRRKRPSGALCQQRPEGVVCIPLKRQERRERMTDGCDFGGAELSLWRSGMGGRDGLAEAAVDRCPGRGASGAGQGQRTRTGRAGVGLDTLWAA